MADGCNHTIQLESTEHAHILQAIARQLEHFYSNSELEPLRLEILQESLYCRVICRDACYNIDDILPLCVEANANAEPKTMTEKPEKDERQSKSDMACYGKHPKLTMMKLKTTNTINMGIDDLKTSKASRL